MDRRRTGNGGENGEKAFPDGRREDGTPKRRNGHGDAHLHPDARDTRSWQFSVSNFRRAAPLAGAQEKTSIKVGMTVSTTGPFAYVVGSKGFRAYKYGWTMLLPGRPVRGELGQQSRPWSLSTTTTAATRRWSRRPAVRAAHYGRPNRHRHRTLLRSPPASAAAPVTEKYNIPLIMWSAAADSLYEQGFQYIISGSQLVTAEYAVTHAPHMVSLG